MASSIEDAIRNARYNEAVVVSVEGNNEEESREIVLIASLDKQNGGVSWQDANADSHPDGFDVGILRHFRTKRWIVPMLNDIHRNNLYENSIRKAYQVCRRIIANSPSPLLRGDIVINWDFILLTF